MAESRSTKIEETPIREREAREVPATKEAPPLAKVGDIIDVYRDGNGPYAGIVTVVAHPAINVTVFRPDSAGGEAQIQLGAGDDGEWSKEPPVTEEAEAK